MICLSLYRLIPDKKMMLIVSFAFHDRQDYIAI